MKQHDIVIIGAGVSGLFAAMKLLEYTNDIIVVDAGHSLNKRLTLLGNNIAENQSLDRFIGFGGLGLSEGKYNYTNDFGGDLGEKIGLSLSMHYQQQVDRILCRYGAEQRPLYNTFNADLVNQAAKVGFNILSTQTRHLGTLLSTHILRQFDRILNNRMRFIFNATVKQLEKQHESFILSLSNQQQIKAKKVIIAVGRSGIDWLEQVANQLNLNYQNTRLDLGFRIEMHGNQLHSLLRHTVETKLHYKNEHCQATTYCMNSKGRVITKYQGDLVLAEGQNSQEVELSHNLNFTLFIPKWFATRKDADIYLTQTITQINQQNGRIAMQRLGDIDSRFTQRFHQIEPTLSIAQLADLSAITPHYYLSQTCDFLHQLEVLLGEPIDGNTILYAMDCKTYAPIIQTNYQFETQISNLYLIGDCSGITSSLSQAAASGVYVGELLSQSLLH